MTPEERQARADERRRRRVSRALVAAAEGHLAEPQDVLQLVDVDAIDLVDDGDGRIPDPDQVADVVAKAARWGNVMWHALDSGLCTVAPPPNDNRLIPAVAAARVNAEAEATDAERAAIGRLERFLDPRFGEPDPVEAEEAKRELARIRERVVQRREQEGYTPPEPTRVPADPDAVDGLTERIDDRIDRAAARNPTLRRALQGADQW